MASIALTVVGGALGSFIAPGAGTLSGAAIGAAIGGAAGGVIDSKFLFPSIFKTNRPIQGNKIDDISLQTASEGSQAKRSLGPLNRYAGAIFWLPPTLIIEPVSNRVGGKSGQTVTSSSAFTHVGIHVCDCPLRPISAIRKIWADGKLIYDNGRLDPRVKGVRIYKGTDTQMPDSLIESFVGIGKQPGHRFTAYVVIEKLALADFGNRLPKFDFLVEDKLGLRVAQAVKEIHQWAGRDPAMISTSRVGKCLSGYTVAGPQRTDQTLEPLILSYDLSVQEVDGQLIYFHRLEADIVDVDEADLSCKQSGEQDGIRGVQFLDPPSFSLPSEVDFAFLDPAISLQRGSARDRRVIAPEENVLQYDVPITFTQGQGRIAARRILRAIWSSRKRVKLNLPPKYFRIAEGDILRVPWKGELYQIRTTRVDRGYNYLIQIEGELIDSETLAGDDEFTDHQVPPDPIDVLNIPVYEPAEVIVKLLDIPAFRDEDLVNPGLYVAACAVNDADRWLGGVLYKSVNNADFETVTPVGVEATIGKTLTILHNGPTSYWDDSHYVDVQLLRGSLQSRTKAEVLGGLNLILIGKEIVGFRTATLIGPKKYRLSGLIRGRRDTVDERGSHQIDEDVVLLDNAVGRFSLNSADLGVQREYKFVPVAGTLDDAATVNVTLKGENMRQFKPAMIKGVHAVDDAITVTWSRRTRALTRLLLNAAGPILADGETYDVEFWNTTGTVLYRMKQTPVPEIEYTAAEQVEDGLTPGAQLLLVKIYMMSQMGRGRAGAKKV